MYNDTYNGREFATSEALLGKKLEEFSRCWMGLVLEGGLQVDW